jgi:hypothetical protein
VAWARKSLVTPAWERPEWVRQHFATPLVVGERVFVLSPGMERVECCDVNTGRLVWQFMDDYPWRVIGTVDEVVIVETEAGFVGLNVADGSVVWRHEETNRRLHALGFDGERLLYFTHAAQENRETPPVAVWLDPRRGQVLGKTSLHDLKHKDPRVGPLVALPDRWWLLAGREREPQRDVFELIPEEPISRWANPTTRDSWCVRLPSDLVEDCEQRLPGWQLVSTHPENRPVDTEWYGEKQVVALGARQDLPLVLTQTSTLPAATRVHLQMRVGHDPGQEGTLRILFGQELVFAQPLNATTQQQRWQSLEIDLTPFAGQTGTLILHYQPTNGGEQQLWFGSLRLLEKSAKKVDE